MKIAACLIVKDEARDIAEWIAYHALAGVDAFLVYDNGSSDGTTEALAAAATLYDVRVTTWRTLSVRSQIEAYNHAIRTRRREFDWIAVFDSDEFIVVHPPNTLRTLCVAADAVAIGINWAIFGSSGLEQLPIQLIIEAFTRRAEIGFGPNVLVKCLVRPDAVHECINPHAFAVDGRMIQPDGRPLAWLRDENGNETLGHAVPDYAVAQINHYFTRSRAHWLRKVARGYHNPLSTHKLNDFAAYDRNEVEDTSALWAVNEVRQRRAAILALALSDPTVPADTKQGWQALQDANIFA